MKKTIILTVIYSLLILKSIYAQNYYKKDGKFGALTSDGSFLTEAKYDTIYDTGFIFKGKFLLSRILNKYGVIIFPSDTSPIIIEPKFDNVYLDNGIVILKIQNKYGFIGFDTKFESGNVFHWMKNVNISDVKYDNIIDGNYILEIKWGLFMRVFMCLIE